jgi:hypothetical protein
MTAKVGAFYALFRLARRSRFAGSVRRARFVQRHRNLDSILSGERSLIILRFIERFRHKGKMLQRRCAGSGSGAVLSGTPTRRPSQMLLKESQDACVEIAVKGCSIETRWIGAEAWQVGGKLRRARRQEREVTSRHNMNLGLARQRI